MAYVVRLEDLAREVHAHTVAAGIAQALGKPLGDDRTDWAAVKARFDAELAAPPAGEQAADDNPRRIKLRVLGVQ